MEYLSPLFQKLSEEYNQKCKVVFPSGLASDSSMVLQKLADVTSHRVDREYLAQQLLCEQQKYGCSSESAASINLLKKSNTGVVVTGQQPNIAGGQLMIIHKALTAVALAKKLSEDNGVAVIPLFWIAGDDSDLHECNYAEDLVHARSYSLDFEVKKSLIQMSHRILDADKCSSLQAFLDSIDANCSFTQLITEGDSITTAFGKMLQSLFGSTGMLFIDGASDLVQRLGRPVLEKCITAHAEIESALRQGEADLKELGESSPVEIKPDTVRAFEVKGAERVRVTSHASESVGKLSHDVLSRPLVCDSIFPVVAHVLGPSELRYFGVLAPLYSLFAIPFPMVYPRCHATTYFTDFTALCQMLECSIDELPAINRSVMIQKLGAHILREHSLTEPFLSMNMQMIHQSIRLGIDESSIKKFLQNHIAVAQKKIIKKITKKAVSQNAQLNDTVHFVYNWFAQTRRQERHMLWVTLARYFSFAEYCKKIDPLSMQHQSIELEKRWNHG